MIDAPALQSLGSMANIPANLSFNTPINLSFNNASFNNLSTLSLNTPPDPTRLHQKIIERRATRRKEKDMMVQILQKQQEQEEELQQKERKIKKLQKEIINLQMAVKEKDDNVQRTGNRAMDQAVELENKQQIIERLQAQLEATMLQLMELTRSKGLDSSDDDDDEPTHPLHPSLSKKNLLNSLQQDSDDDDELEHVGFHNWAAQAVAKFNEMLRLISTTEATLDAMSPLPATPPPTSKSCTFAVLRIESCNSLWNTHTESTKDVLLNLVNFIRPLALHHNGYEVRSAGDYYCFLFPDALSALWFCMDMHDHMNNTKTENAPKYKARAGVHGGDVDFRVEFDTTKNRNIYSGPAVELATRLMAQAHGGETVFSEWVHQEFYLHEEEMPYFIEIQRLPLLATDNEGRPLKLFSAVIISSEQATQRLADPEEELPQFWERKRMECLEGIQKVNIAVDGIDTESSGIGTVIAPSGSVSLVFTDVQSSTKLWDTNLEMMKEAICLHNFIMRRVIHQYRGYEVKTEGDAFMVAFNNPIEAMSYCLEAQRSLLDASWSETLLQQEDAKVEQIENKIIWRGLRVRMGIHHGDAICESDGITGRMDYFGPVVNKAARVSGCARGGEVVISSEVHDYLQEANVNWDWCPPVYYSLGMKTLKGIRQSCLLYAVLPSELIERFKYGTVVTSVPEPNPETAGGRLSLTIKHRFSQLQKKLQDNEQTEKRLKDLEKEITKKDKEVEDLTYKLTFEQQHVQRLRLQLAGALITCLDPNDMYSPIYTSSPSLRLPASPSTRWDSSPANHKLPIRDQNTPLDNNTSSPSPLPRNVSSEQSPNRNKVTFNDHINGPIASTSTTTIRPLNRIPPSVD